MLLLTVAKILEAPVRVLQERLGCPPRQRAGLEEGLLLLLMFVDQLEDQSHSVVVGIV